MKKDEFIARVKGHEREIRALGVTELYLFGSTARDAARHDSDVDVFIEYDRGRKFSLLDLAGMKVLLDEILDAPTDIGTKASLHPRIREEVMAEAVRVI